MRDHREDKTASRSASALVRIGLALVVGLAGGLLFSLLGIPLAWMLGPFVFCAALSIAGLQLRAASGGRESGQLIVGLTVGSLFTPPILAATSRLLPAMVAATAFVIVVTTLAALLLVWLAKFDYRTAFFSTAAAGMADMATIAANKGGDQDVVAVMHAIRVASVVLTVPLLVLTFSGPTQPASFAAAADVAWPNLGLALALSWCAAIALKKLLFPNPWMVGPVFLGAILAGTEALSVAVPSFLIILAQVLIGISLGCRFTRDLIVRLPRVVAIALAVSTSMIAAACGGAWLLTLATDLPFATGFLAVAPAAITEMVITAKTLGIDAEVVTAFHVMRIAVIASTIMLTFNAYERIYRRLHESRP